MSVRFREVASGLGLTEGPLWTSRATLIVTSITRGLVYEIDPSSGATKVYAETGGGPNGLAEDDEGTIWVAQNGGGHLGTRSTRPTTPSIQRIRDGVVEDVVTVGLASPNDCVIAPDSRLWFTDPHGDPYEGDPVPGRIHALDLRSGQLDLIVEGPLYPNGLAFGPGGEDFYVAETRTRRILRAPYTGRGIGQLELFAQIPDGEPDGMTTDADGNVYLANAGGSAVYVFDRDGAHLGRIDVGGGERVVVTNLCFGGPGLETAFLTVAKGGRVLACERADLLARIDPS